MLLIILTINLYLIKLVNCGCCCSAEEKKNVETFDQYTKCFQHAFHRDDHDYRKSIFEENMNTIRTLRSIHKSATFGPNKYSHLTHDEFKARFLGYAHGGTHSPTFKKSKGKFAEVDWRKKGVVSKVKNQKQCGSCYAFSAVSAIESHSALKTGHLSTYSEQQVVDCSKEYGNSGCNGGLMDNVFNYSQHNGLMSDHTYPYVGKEQTCEYNESAVIVSITGWTDLESGSEDDLTKALRTIGPVSVAIDAGLKSFMFYSGGIYDDPECSPINLNHGVAAVGVAKDYYIVRNSWGKGWGEEGYVRIARNHQNRCGIATVASYPNLS